jgi:O-methyltransferase
MPMRCAGETRMFESVRRLLVRAQALGNHQSVLDHALAMQMINQVPGDYLEFGVFRGDRLIQAYETASFLTKWVRSQKDPYAAKASARNLESMRFFGFDSFEGLPKATPIDVAPGQEEWIGEGGFCASLDEVRGLMPAKALAEGRIRLVKGWFEATLTKDLRQALELREAAIVYVDCDYYTSTVPVLEFVTDLLVDGSILIFDDWFLFRGRSDRGEQRAFYEWKERHGLKLKEFIPGTAMSFMVER